MDDVGAVLQRMVVQLPLLLHAFKLFGEAAGTALNIAKCLIIPLWCEPIDVAMERIRRLFPEFAAVKVAWKGKLLGVMIGPEAGRSSWVAPLLKVERRIPIVRGLKRGLSQTIGKYNQVAYSTLSHTACFYSPDPTTLKQERVLHQRLPGAPRYTFTTDLLEGLDEVGLRNGMCTLRCNGAAAQWRCVNVTSQNFWPLWNKLHQCDRDDDLGEDMWLQPRNRAWVFGGSIMAQSYANHVRVQGFGAQLPVRPDARRGIQRAAALVVRGKIDREPPIRVLQRKLSVRLGVAMDHEADRIQAVCLNVGKLRQAFLASMVKTWVGAWCTAHRFTHEARGPCAFGCGCPHGDHPLHYVMCDVYLALVQHVAPQLRDLNTEGLPFAAICLRVGASPEEQRAWATFLYVLFTTYEGLRAQHKLHLSKEVAFKTLLGKYNLLTIQYPGYTADVRRFQ